MQAMGAFSGDTTPFPATRDVMARAVATRATPQTTCPIPLALDQRSLGAAGPTGAIRPGEWVTAADGPEHGHNGQMGWANLDGTNDAAETMDEMEGECGVQFGDELGTPGVQPAIALTMELPFRDLQEQCATPPTQQPDLSGLRVHRGQRLPPSADGTPPNAYDGTPPAGATPPPRTSRQNAKVRIVRPTRGFD